MNKKVRKIRFEITSSEKNIATKEYVDAAAKGIKVSIPKDSKLIKVHVDTIYSDKAAPSDYQKNDIKLAPTEDEGLAIYEGSEKIIEIDNFYAINPAVAQVSLDTLICPPPSPEGAPGKEYWIESKYAQCVLLNEDEEGSFIWLFLLAAIALPAGGGGNAPTDPHTGKTAALTGLTNDTGSVSNDYIASDTTLVLIGKSTATDGTNVQIVIDGLVKGTAKVTSGLWSFDNTATTLSEGSHTITANLINAAGNIVISGTPITITIDTTAPTALAPGAHTLTY